ncbi:hypothetical protein [Streptomyces sp. ITFR-6]|uniref:hypothetical protein n=1 Tax=Streptomyces sp. ITFR-6 TaxID=3075197 RepID=UPI00288981D1|nr:hypothetical protein [Streptomyces sp. ITFR-6]WNI27784.1 hypothetical protein RLT59_02620 [Streptomyces sp. ITFR-6]
MTFINVLVLVAVVVPIALLAVAPSVPARRNPFPDRTRRRPTAARPSEMPHQQTNRHHAR